ncbi:hypothetical protein CBM2592_B10184 [Cupriavidus taiwanensis]|nr:hypothetical protein CBM2588_B10179 [Cupriavidus taiwanensis]SOY59920.1 hypothetical protein CBM2592_B10184 [Cupriavidus taiwanensis]SOY91958.1 hypothetical protein CBM2591_B10182 [Cupriavidus taiwanensis]SOZ28688.1 hypothetical protein CBM2608_B140588 [Cupriavidus taiwanensis]SOZ65826.1 hypothetical protein CBM2617_B10025 [Cupriavidus taiwanensis]
MGWCRRAMPRRRATTIRAIRSLGVRSGDRSTARQLADNPRGLSDAPEVAPALPEATPRVQRHAPRARA